MLRVFVTGQADQTTPTYTVTVPNLLTQVQQDIAAAAAAGDVSPARPSTPSRRRTTHGSGWS